MGRSQLRMGVWALAILTCLTVAGGHTAYADDLAKLEAEGWFFTFNCAAPNCSAEVKFGITGKEDDHHNKFGRFEYFNTFTGLRVHGKLTTLTFHDNTCPTPPPNFGGPPLGSPAATMSGLCDDNEANCRFQMDVVDGGSARGNDWVCNIQVTGQNKNHTASSDTDMNANQVFKGKVKIRNYN
jgi:hypothetical protein